MVWRVCGGGDWFVDAIAIKEKSTLYKVSRFLSALIRLMSQSLRRTLLYGLRSCSRLLAHLYYYGSNEL